MSLAKQCGGWSAVFRLTQLVDRQDVSSKPPSLFVILPSERTFPLLKIGLPVFVPPPLCAPRVLFFTQRFHVCCVCVCVYRARLVFPQFRLLLFFQVSVFFQVFQVFTFNITLFKNVLLSSIRFLNIVECRFNVWIPWFCPCFPQLWFYRALCLLSEVKIWSTVSQRQDNLQAYTTLRLVCL